MQRMTHYDASHPQPHTNLTQTTQVIAPVGSHDRCERFGCKSHFVRKRQPDSFAAIVHCENTVGLHFGGSLISSRKNSGRGAAGIIRYYTRAPALAESQRSREK